MSTATNLFSYPSSGTDDPLELLPHTPVREYKKNEVIHDAEDRPEYLYLVIDGRIKASRQPEGREVILDFYHKDDFFGEAAFLGAERYGEQAAALDRTTVMAWSVADLRRLMGRTPTLGPALLRVVARKLADANERVESFCLDPINRRLVKALLRLGARSGQPSETSLLHVPPVTHEQLARYVGTSREIVTQYMNQFRRDQLLKYSRRGLELDLEALRQYLAKA